MQTLQEKKRLQQPITAITAYDYPTARLADEAGIDLILVGDSVAMAVLGHDDTLSLTVDEMLHHARAVRRGVQQAFLTVDMPYGSCHVNSDDTVRHALRFIKEAGADAVKIEGGRKRAPLIEQLAMAEILVVGHIGLMPQSVHRMGGYKVQGRSVVDMQELIDDALALEHAGAVAIVLEGIPRELAADITRAVGIPTIGIGAGPDCDGQILVFHDLFRLTFSPSAKFVRSFGDAEHLMRDGLADYCAAVKDRTFPADGESYHLPAKTVAELAHEQEAEAVAR